MSDIAVIGAGSYGSCLAMLFGRAGFEESEALSQEQSGLLTPHPSSRCLVRG